MKKSKPTKVCNLEFDDEYEIENICSSSAEAIRPDHMAVKTLERHLASANYACVVVGAGVRLPPQSLVLFEAIINAIHRAAPGTAIAFNTRH